MEKNRMTFTGNESLAAKFNLLAKGKNPDSPGFLEDETGMGTIEVILIIVVLIGLVLIFKDQLSGLIERIFQTINSNSDEVTSPMTSWIQRSGMHMA